MAKTVTTVVTPYELSVDDAVICFREDGAYEDAITRVPEIKTLSVAPDNSTKKIYASAKVRDITVNTRGASLSLDVVALPPAFINRAAGAEGEGDALYEVSLPKLPEFGFGYICDNSDGSQVYYWHPRCKLTISDESHATSDDGDIDPSVSYTIEAMPTEEGIWKVKYDTRTVTGTALDAEAFFSKTPYTKADCNAITGA